MTARDSQAHSPTSAPHEALGALPRVLLDSLDVVPAEFRDDWADFLDGTVLGEVWDRAALPTRDRSLVTIAALASMGCRIELKAQMRAALENGISRPTLYEVLFHVGGYAGYGVGLEALAILNELLESDPDLGAQASELDAGREGMLRDGDRAASADAVLDVLLRNRAGMTARRQYDFAPEWRTWLTETCFGYCWARPNLTLVERSRVTMAIVMALGQETPLRSHIGVARNLGIPQAEIGEQIMHLSIYRGYSAGVVAMQIAEEVFAEAMGRAPVPLVIATPAAGDPDGPTTH
jgi:4-carboxymuconolactone decarboxylase